MDKEKIDCHDGRQEVSWCCTRGECDDHTDDNACHGFDTRGRYQWLYKKWFWEETSYFVMKQTT